MNTAKEILEIQSLCVSYGAINAVENVSFKIKQAEIVALIGANGAGKTSILRAISALTPCQSGKIIFAGEEIQNLDVHSIVRKGVLHAPEGRGIFLNLSIEENLDLGAWCSADKNLNEATLQYVFELFPRLKERRKQNAGTLSGGEQQMLAIGRSLMGQPKLLLLDEPSLGLAPQIIELIFEIIVKINKDGKTVLLVEQNALQALEIANYGIVLETGKVALSGSAEELKKSDAVRKAYLG